MRQQANGGQPGFDDLQCGDNKLAGNIKEKHERVEGFHAVVESQIGSGQLIPKGFLEAGILPKLCRVRRLHGNYCEAHFPDGIQPLDAGVGRGWIDWASRGVRARRCPLRESWILNVAHVRWPPLDCPALRVVSYQEGVAVAFTRQYAPQMRV